VVKLPKPTKTAFTGRVSETGKFGEAHSGEKDRRSAVGTHSAGHREFDESAFGLHETVKLEGRVGSAHRPLRTRDEKR
jgi:hypothetical protein